MSDNPRHLAVDDLVIRYRVFRRLRRARPLDAIEAARLSALYLRFERADDAAKSPAQMWGRCWKYVNGWGVGEKRAA